MTTSDDGYQEINDLAQSAVFAFKYAAIGDLFTARCWADDISFIVRELKYV